MKPLVVELFCGMFGWSQGWLKNGGLAVGFDWEHLPHHGSVPVGASLALQDVLTLEGSQFKNADLLLCSPPCQEFSYMAMPWSRSKQLIKAFRGEAEFPVGHKGSRTLTELTALFDACFRIQREASEAAGRYIPMVVENVKGAQPWVGPAKARYGSFYLWGDVGRVGNRIVAGDLSFTSGICPRDARKNNGGSWFAIGSPGQSNVGQNPDGRKLPAHISDSIRNGKSPARWTNPEEHYFGPIEGLKGPGGDWFLNGRQGQDACLGGLKRPGITISQGFNNWPKDENGAYIMPDGTKQGGNWWHDPQSMTRKHSSRSSARKAASAQIAKIPLPLSRYIANAFWPKAIDSIAI